MIAQQKKMRNKTQQVREGQTTTDILSSLVSHQMEIRGYFISNNN